MNRLSPEERARIIQMLCEGMSVRAIERTERVSKNTILKLLVDAGKASASLKAGRSSAHSIRSLAPFSQLDS